MVQESKHEVTKVVPGRKKNVEVIMSEVADAVSVIATCNTCI